MRGPKGRLAACAHSEMTLESYAALFSDVGRRTHEALETLGPELLDFPTLRDEVEDILDDAFDFLSGPYRRREIRPGFVHAYALARVQARVGKKLIRGISEESLYGACCEKMLMDRGR